ncbi:hypothetical protein JAAARDRAFT_35144 [Jaapia argillacea MUCL 33604]|uniref:Glutaredoxin domain-containing protein n=1 Tax=Jaapia argillacea MUCL 33604 TaxID=933084 RepID=A0A067Q4D5_9AGAM|nr:hypothetical protein JAAARDRAFT_35144 [Jaapia argillacea MUCL 33604]
MSLLPTSRPLSSSYPARQHAPYRRRRIIWSLLLLSAFCLTYFHFYPSSSFPLSLTSLSPSTNWRPDRNGDAPPPEPEVQKKPIKLQEIYGLLHFLTSAKTSGLMLDEVVVRGLQDDVVDWGKPVDFRVYANGEEDDWDENARELLHNYPVVVFSKTYCPYSKRGKALLETYSLSPSPKIIELDLRTDSHVIKQILTRTTGRSTVPNILLTGRDQKDMSIGGSDDIHQLHERGELRGIFEEAGLKVNGSP